MSPRVLFSASNMIRTLEVLIISIFLSRVILDKDTLGQFLQIIFISSVIVTLVSGIPLSVNFFYGKYSDEKIKEQLFAKFSFAISAFSLIVCIFLFIFREFISENFNNRIYENFIFILLIFFFLKSLNSIFPNYHYLTNRISKYLILYCATTGLLIGFFFYDYVMRDYSSKIILTQLLTIEVVRLLINVFIVNKKEIKLKSILLNKEELRYTLIISFGVTLGALNLYIDKYLVGILLTPVEFAYYQNGAINLPFVNIITSSLFISMIPLFANLYTNGERKKLLYETKKAILKCSFFLLPILVYCFFEALALVTFIYGDSFESSGEVFKIYILRYAMSVMAYSIYMGSIGLEKKSNIVVFVSALIGLILNIVLIPYFGIIGAAWSIVIASLTTVFISLYFINVGMKVKVFDYFPLKDYFKMILYSVILYVPFYFLNSFFDKKWMTVIFSFVYYMIVIVCTNYELKLYELNKIFKRTDN